MKETDTHIPVPDQDAYVVSWTQWAVKIDDRENNNTRFIYYGDEHAAVEKCEQLIQHRLAKRPAHQEENASNT